MFRSYALIALLLLLAGCDALAPTIEPTRALSAPTLAPTSNAVIPAPPTEVPGSFIDPFGSNNPTAAALPSDLDLPPLILDEVGADGGRVVSITLSDGGVVGGVLYPDVPVRAPGLLLIAEDRAVWGDLPPVLEANGYIVLAVDLPATTTIVQFRDVLASFVDFAQADDSRLDPGRMAVIGEDTGANIALLGCAADLRCDAAALLSPTAREALGAVATSFSRPLLVSASRDDALAFTAAEAVAASAAGEVLFQPFNSAGRGAAMLQNRPDMVDLLLRWLTEAVR